jgi:Fe-S cluster biogenesis protein NfuA
VLGRYVAAVVILPEHTPNPDCLKLHAGRDLGVSDAVEFSARDAAESGSPLASRLLALPGMRRVLIAPRFVSITKDRDAPWRPLAEAAAAILREHLAAGAPPLRPGWSPPPRPAGDAESAHVRALVEREVRPLVARDGGDVEFVSWRGGVLELALRGACADCPSSAQTLRLGIEARLRELLPDLVEVVSR